MRAAGAGCHDAIAALARFTDDGKLRLVAMKNDGTTTRRADIQGELEHMDEIVAAAARELMDRDG